MKLEGIHHVTAITADAPRNVDFYTRVLGLRLVKKTVNQDDPTVYHLFYADEEGSAGSDITFFEYPGARRGRAGAGMVHTVAFRVASEDALAFWEQRLVAAGAFPQRSPGRLELEDPEGLGLELVVSDTTDRPLVAVHPEIPAEVAIQGFDGVRAFAGDPERSRGLYAYDAPPASGPGMPGAGTVHHVAWASTMEDHEHWQRLVAEAGAHATPVIDRFWFRSIYFREPSGVLFEIATLGPGFTSDEPLESLGERLSLPPDYEPLRDRLEEVLTPLPDPRAAWSTK